MITYNQLEEVLEKKVKEWQEREKQPVSQVLSLLNENLFVKSSAPPQDVVAALMSELSGQGLTEEFQRRLSDPYTRKEYDLWMLLSEYHNSSLE